MALNSFKLPMFLRIVNYWTVPGVTKPQHYWPFKETGNYTDQGSTKGLNLTAAGSGNTFSSDGLVLNGSGWAIGDNNADICDVGAVFSVLLEYTVSIDQYHFPFSASANYDAEAINGIRIDHEAGGTITTRTWNDGTGASVWESMSLLDVPNQIVWVQNNGYATIYRNGVEEKAATALATPGADIYHSFAIGAVDYNGSYGQRITGTIHRVGVLKGTAWSAQDVEDIYDVLGCWPLLGVTRPQHQWPFHLTQNYTDRGSIGDLDLTEGGSGNSFDSNGLNFTGSGWATGGNDSDYALGDTWSIQLEFTTGSDVTNQRHIFDYGYPQGAENGFTFFVHDGYFKASIQSVSSISLFAVSTSTSYEVIITCESGTISWYVNGTSYINQGSVDAILYHTTKGLTVGYRIDGAYYFDGIIKQISILKGIAWSSANADTIYNNL